MKDSTCYNGIVKSDKRKQREDKDMTQKEIPRAFMEGLYNINSMTDKRRISVWLYKGGKVKYQIDSGRVVYSNIRCHETTYEDYFIAKGKRVYLSELTYVVVKIAI